MANIAADLRQALEHRRAAGQRGRATPRVIAHGEGWSVADVVCTSGPQDRPFEERSSHYSLALVLAGTFQYRAATGYALMTPGSLMLANAGQCYECGHEHGEGDRCVSFWYASDYFEQLAADAGARGRSPALPVPRLPPLAPLTPLAARAAAGVLEPDRAAWEELAIRLAASAVALSTGASPGGSRAPHNAEARVSRVVRAIGRHPDHRLTLGGMAREAGLSPYHFLRTFERVTGVTPHRFLVRARLRDAALRLATTPDTVLDTALASGFGDVSSFNRAFRTEFGESPRAYRRGTAPAGSARAARRSG